MRQLVFFLFCVWLLSGGALPPARAQAARPGETGSPLETVQNGRPFGQAEMQLKANKVLVTPRAYRQIFEPYLNPEGPIFITADAILIAYHTLMSASFKKFEQINARRLPDVLTSLWSKFNRDQDENAKAGGGADAQPGENEADAEFIDIRQKSERYTRFVLAVALKLLDQDPVGLEAELQQPVQDTLNKILSGGSFEAAAKGEVAIFDIDAVETARFVPPDFYSRSQTLRRYYQAMRWLQTARFRIESDAELLAILMLGKAVSAAQTAKGKDARGVADFFRCYHELVGAHYDRDVLLAAQIVRERPSDLGMVRAYLEQIDAQERHRSEAMPPAATAPSAAPAEAFTVIAPGHRSERRLFETILYGAIDSSDGIAICAALGSPYARREWTRNMAPQLRDRLLGALDRLEPVSPDMALYDLYLNCLAALLDPVEPDAPLFMFTDAWEMKSCNAVLAGWVQAGRLTGLRLEAEEGSGGEFYGVVPDGFVEPEPEFFARLGELIGRSREILERCAVFVAPRRVFAEDLRRLASLMQQHRYPVQTGTPDGFSPEEREAVDRSLKILAVIDPSDTLPVHGSTAEPAAINAIRAMAADIESGQYEDDPTYQALIIETHVDLNQLWRMLGQLCRHIEVMAHKQLRGVAFNERDTYFIADFGIRLATVMLYGGDRSRYPVDDFPSLLRLPAGAAAAHPRYGGVGRPRELLVSYPFGGREILCRGAVAPYYETELRRPLSEPDWIRRLDSDERPPTPHWFAPIVAPGPIEKTWQK